MLNRPKHKLHTYLFILLLLTVCFVLSQGLHVSADDAPLSTDLPINIAAIGRQETALPIYSLRLMQLDLFSPTSGAINEALIRQRDLHRTGIQANLFARFVEPELIDANERAAASAMHLGLFLQPMTFRSIGQADDDGAMSILLIAAIMAACAVAGYVFARAFIKKKEKAEA